MDKSWPMGNGVSGHMLPSPIHSGGSSEEHSMQLFRRSKWD